MIDCGASTAAVDGAVGDGAPTIVYTDGACIGNGSVGAKPKLAKSMARWRLNGWTNVKGTDVQNRDLLERLDKLMAGDVKIKFEKVLGHSGNYGNEQADMLAKRGAEMYTGNAREL
uniref:ribonuclease H n=1 Tax=Globodera pallida TaxID=36090 RepID=A0A183C3E0_GLOPA